MKVIIIDDSSEYLDLMKNIFELGGYQVDIFNDKHTGYNALMNNSYEITVIGRIIIENRD